MAREIDGNFISTGFSIFVVAGLTGAAVLPTWISLEGSSCGVDYLGAMHTFTLLSKENINGSHDFMHNEMVLPASSGTGGAVSVVEVLPWEECVTGEAQLMLRLMASCLLAAWLSSLVSVWCNAVELASRQSQFVQKSAIGNIFTVLSTCLVCALCYWLVVVLCRREFILQGTTKPHFTAQFGPGYWLVVTSGVLALGAMAANMWQPSQRRPRRLPVMVAATAMSNSWYARLDDNHDDRVPALPP